MIAGRQLCTSRVAPSMVGAFFDSYDGGGCGFGCCEVGETAHVIGD